MDLLFGTYRCPDHEPERFGLNQPTPRTYLGFMFRPLLPKKRRARATDAADSPVAEPVGEGAAV